MAAPTAEMMIASSVNKRRTSRRRAPSAILSASGMSLIVFGALQSKTWGWLVPLDSPVINGQAIAPLGISLVAYFIVAGIILLQLFLRRQRALEASGGSPLLRVSLFKIPALRSGLSVLLAQYFTIAAIFFVIPVYLQTILGYDALETGIRLLPLSIGLIIFTLVGSRLSTAKGPKKVVRMGQIALSLGSLMLLASISPTLGSVLFTVGLFIIGAGFGFMASQIGNVNLSAVPKEATSEVGGLQGTYQNLGTSFGTALAGSVFILILTSSFSSGVTSSSLPADVKTNLASYSSSGVDIMTPSDVEAIIASKGQSQEIAEEVAAVYETAQIEALRTALFAVFVVSIFALIASRNLPITSPSQDA